MRMSRLLVVPVVAAVLAIPNPASAGTGSTSSGNGVLYDVCHDHPWSASVDPDGDDWRLDVTVVDPQGNIFATDQVVGETDLSTSIEGDWTFCGNEFYGHYTVQSTLTEYLPNGDVDSETPFADDTFVMRKPRSRTVLKVSDLTPHYNETVRFRATSKKEHPGGYARAPYAVTRLQFKSPQGWVNLRRSQKTASAKGVTVWRYYWNVTSTYRVRAVTVRDFHYKGSVSGIKKVNQTPGGRVLARPAGGVVGVAP
jgi:hypothetical protein